MVLNRNSTRRRRLAVDPAIQLGEAPVILTVPPHSAPQAGVSETVDARAYSYGAERRSQRKTTDLIPKRMVSYLVVVMLLLAMLWLINFTSLNVPQWTQLGPTALETFAIRGQGSLASWFSSFLLIMTGLASLQIYALRQHRCDDYRGTYRLWLWTAGLLILASINCVADLDGVALALLQSTTGGAIFQRVWVPMAIQIGAITLLFARGLFEVRESRGSLVLVVFVWVAYSVAAVLQSPMVNQNVVGGGSEMVIGNSLLFGTAALFLAHITFARFIYLHANGLIVLRVKQERESVTRETKSADKRKAVKKNASLDIESESENAAEQADSGRQTKRKSKRKLFAAVAAEELATEKQAAGSASDVSTPLRKAKMKRQPTAVPAPVSKAKLETAASTQPAVRPASKPEKSPSDVLKELAAASRAKESSTRSSSHSAAHEDEEEHEGVINMSKSQRRKSRKATKQQRRRAA